MKINILLSNRTEYNDIEFEKQFVTPICLGGSVFSLIAIFINSKLNFGLVLTLIPYISLVVYALLYYFAYKGKILNFVKWATVLTTFFLVNLLWYYNFGSHGPALYLFVIIFSYMIFMLDGKQLLLAGILLVINVAGLYYIESHHPEIVGRYPNRQDRIEDVYTGISMYLFIIFIMMRGAKNTYITQYKKAKKADQLKSSFLANMSHEIRTPLNAIVGFSNILADENLTSEEKKQYAVIINSSNNSLLRLVNDILDVSMIESDQLSLVPSKCDIGNLMDNLEETYLLKIHENPGISLVNTKVPGHVYVKTDCARLQQVMVNLLDNAIKYTEKGEVEFGFFVEEKSLKFYVKDSGIGIKDSHLNYLFDRFYKVEDDNTKLFRGTGIGLYLSKKIVGMLGGEIWVSSKFGEGSAFYFTVPKEEFYIQEENSAQKTGINPFAGNKEMIKILIVEDQESNQQYLAAILKADHFELVQAYNGTEGIEAFEKNPDVDLILLDLKMPDLNGFEVLKEIRKKDTKIPIIAQTAYAMAADREECLEAGFNDYIAKPVHREVLFNLIAKHLPQSQG
ncbi:MAG: response regulator [Bacteroidales bacterium]|nr:response regulator [Bacteroidales bacterium]